MVGTTDKYNMETLRDLIFRRKKDLLVAFMAADTNGEGNWLLHCYW